MTKNEMRALLASIGKRERRAKTTYYAPGKAINYAAAPRRTRAPGPSLGWQDIAAGKASSGSPSATAALRPRP